MRTGASLEGGEPGSKANTPDTASDIKQVKTATTLEEGEDSNMYINLKFSQLAERESRVMNHLITKQYKKAAEEIHSIIECLDSAELTSPLPYDAKEYKLYVSFYNLATLSNKWLMHDIETKGLKQQKPT